MTVRLLFVAPPNLHPGVYQQIDLAVKHLPRDELEVHVCCLSRPTRRSVAWKKHHVSVHHVPIRFSVDPTFWRKFLTTLYHHEFDLIHIWNGTETPGIWAASLTARIPIVVGHESCGAAWARPYPSLVSRLAKRSLAVVAHWQGLDSVFVDAVIPPACGPVEIDPQSRQAQSYRFRDSMGIPRDAKLIGAVGRFRYDEGFKDAIWVLDLLKVVRDDVHLVLIGSGPQEWRLRRFVQQTETAGHVHLISESRLDEILPSFDLFWRTNLHPISPAIAIHAMGLGIPVIASDLPIHREFVIDGETGFLYPPRNRAMLARKTQILLEDTEYRNRLGNAGRSFIQERFGLEKTMSRWASFYREVVSWV